MKCQFHDLLAQRHSLTKEGRIVSKSREQMTHDMTPQAFLGRKFVPKINLRHSLSNTLQNVLGRLHQKIKLLPGLQTTVTFVIDGIAGLQPLP